MPFSQKVKVKNQIAGNINVAQKEGKQKSHRFNKQVSTRFGISMAVPVENFAEKYEFKRQPSVRSPLRGTWGADIFDDPYQREMRPKEAAMVRGEPSGFKCHERSKGSLRLSGGLKGRKAHQIGKR